MNIISFCCVKYQPSLTSKYIIAMLVHGAKQIHFTITALKLSDPHICLFLACSFLMDCVHVTWLSCFCLQKQTKWLTFLLFLVENAIFRIVSILKFILMTFPARNVYFIFIMWCDWLTGVSATRKYFLYCQYVNIFF